jgi:transposase-like protein
LTFTQADLVHSIGHDVVVSSRSDQPKKRRFSEKRKSQILAEYEAATAPGEKGMIVRREGIYHSTVSTWRRAAAANAIAGTRPPKLVPTAREFAAMQARAEKAEAELAKTKAALDIVGKAHALLEALSESAGVPKQ